MIYLYLYPYDDDLQSFPRIVMTRDVPWDPTRYDETLSDKILDALAADDSMEQIHDGFNHYGELMANILEHWEDDDGEPLHLDRLNGTHLLCLPRDTSHRCHP